MTTELTMAATLHHAISEYFVREVDAKDSLSDAAASSAVLLTPENSPPKEFQCHIIMPKKDLSDRSTSKTNYVNTSPKATLSRSQSESCVDSPPPTQSKLTRSELDTSNRPNNKPVLAKPAGHGRGRAGRIKKDASKTKAGSAKSEAGSAKGSKQNNKPGKFNEKSVHKSSRSQSVPGESRNSSKTKNSLLTDYFPVRRSSRLPSAEVKKLQQKELEDKILSGCEDGLKVVHFEGKGRGVVSTKQFKRGEFIVEYNGDLLDATEAKKREATYSANPDFGCYMYYFNFKDKRYCVDATKETDKLGRLLNHSKLNGNCVTKVVGIGDRPYLILVAARDIEIGEELLYDYGDRSKQAIQAHPWLAQ